MSIPIITGQWTGLSYNVHTDDGDVIIYYKSNEPTNTGAFIKYTRSSFIWEDFGSDNPYSFSTTGSTSGETSLFNPVSVYGFHSDSYSRLFEFSNPHWESNPQPVPPSEPPTGTEGEDVSAKAEISPTGGEIHTTYKYLAWDNVTMSPTSDFTNDEVIYRRYGVDGYVSHSRYNISYTQSTKVWSEAPGDYYPFSLNSVNHYTSSTSTVFNPQTIFGYTDTGGLYVEFSNPWFEYIAPPPPIYVTRSGRRANHNFW